jgi:F-box protein 21
LDQAGLLTELTINSRVEDKSVRYVAEENIEPVGPRMAELPKMLVAIAGKHFKRWDEETRVFVSNIRDEYPED